MLDIEILEPGKNVTLGNGLLRILQNEFTPNADLLVRESVQNSLDAAREDFDFINMDFTVGTFQSNKLANKLDRIGNTLNKRFPEEQKYLSIRDSGTVGLTGPLSHDEIQGQDFGNLLKLVYEIAKPQEQLGAGGSWGYGKTIFYRLGIGLVIYYSRIKTDQNKFEERLSCVLVENERKIDAIIPAYNGITRSGVAWWGEKVSENTTKPITDPTQIKKMLDIFDIEQYSGKDTGTNIIIPYIDEKEILRHNSVRSNNNQSSETIFENLSDYLELAIQRWYAPRLNNPHYKYGNKKYLKVSINGVELTSNDESKYFSLIRDMYNFGVTGKLNMVESSVDLKSLNREVIRLNNNKIAEFDSSEIGYLVYSRFNYDELGMLRSNDPLNPHFLSLIEEENTDQRTSIVTYCRQPGMLINYEDKGPWANNLPISDSENYILAIFVLNSNNKIRFSNGDIISLEEYVRQGEEADHIAWSDHQKMGDNPRIIRRIQNNINKKLKDAFENDETNIPKTNDGRLSMMAGKLILPPQGFGKKASKQNKTRKSTNTITRNTRGGKTKILYEDIEYDQGLVKIPVEFLILENDVSSIVVDLEIKKDANSSTMEEFESDLMQNSNMYIHNVDLISNIHGNFVYKKNFSSKNIKIFYTSFGTPYKFEINKTFKIGEIIKGEVTLNAVTKDIAPVLRLNIVRGGL